MGKQRKHRQRQRQAAAATPQPALATPTGTVSYNPPPLAVTPPERLAVDLCRAIATMEKPKSLVLHRKVSGTVLAVIQCTDLESGADLEGILKGLMGTYAVRHEPIIGEPPPARDIPPPPIGRRTGPVRYVPDDRDELDEDEELDEVDA